MVSPASFTGDLSRITFDAEHRQHQDQRRDDDGAAADAEQAGQKAGEAAKPDQQRPA
jgi:hypothetical protein